MCYNANILLLPGKVNFLSNVISSFLYDEIKIFLQFFSSAVRAVDFESVYGGKMFS